jgi:hypothetical protein
MEVLTPPRFNFAIFSIKITVKIVSVLETDVMKKGMRIVDTHDNLALQTYRVPSRDSSFLVR